MILCLLLRTFIVASCTALSVWLRTHNILLLSWIQFILVLTPFILHCIQTKNQQYTGV